MSGHLTTRTIQIIRAAVALLFVISTTHASAQELRPNEVTNVDFLERQNRQRHRTDRYWSGLVLRRGELFDLNIFFGRNYNKLWDRTRLEFCFGDAPALADGSLVYVPVVADRVPEWAPRDATNETTGTTTSYDKWDSRVLAIGQTGGLLSVQVNMPASMPVGRWQLRISTKLDNTSSIQTYIIRQPLSVIFNAWSSHDQVHLPGDESQRQEYLMNEIGMIYTGTYSHPIARAWNYGQFDPAVLPTILLLLDKVRLTPAERADVVKVSRAVSAISNSNDEGGLLVGEWNGKYTDGLSPWKWTDSATIFRKFIANGHRQVKYGQCWVFGGLTTTVLRALGIPARAITNFVSAHDTDKSLTVDKFFSERGQPLEGVNGDSIWNFHVWSDAWMARDDLPPGYGGWQAIDATPQETSMRVYQMGPTSLRAIKEGHIDYAYDGIFVFAEVNADVAYWQLDRSSRWGWRRTRSQPGHFARKILTKRVGSMDSDNIVDQYKFPDGSAESQRAYRTAAAAGNMLNLLN